MCVYIQLLFAYPGQDEGVLVLLKFGFFEKLAEFVIATMHITDDNDCAVELEFSITGVAEKKKVYTWRICI